MRICKLLLAGLFCAAVVLIACKRSSMPAEEVQSSNVTPGQQKEPEEPPTVRFDIQRASSSDGSADFQNYDCTYRAGGKVAKFRLRLKQHGPLKGEIPMAFTEGSFIAVKDSDNSVLLKDLKVALEAKSGPTPTVRVKELQFNAVILAEHQSESGRYCKIPCGDWTAMKLFVPKGGDDGELFLNFNPILGKAEFSIKDSDYGDYLLEQFAKVF